jgi:hypothetical protein
VLFEVPQVASYDRRIHIMSLHLIYAPITVIKKERERKKEEKEVKKREVKKIERGLCCSVLLKISVTLIW